MDKIVKEDENFTWFETESGVGYVASKKLFFHNQPDRLSPRDHIVDDNEMISDSQN